MNFLGRLDIVQAAFVVFKKGHYPKQFLPLR